jgi:hypothetical protein
VKARGILAGISAIVLTGFVLYMAAPAWAVDEVDRIRDKCDEFFSTLTKRQYDLFVKQKDPQIARTHNDFSYLFKQKKVELLRERARTTSDTAEARSMELLSTALRHAAVRSYATEDIDQMYEFMMTAKVDLNGKTIPFGQIPRALALEEDRDVRRQVFISYNTPLEPLSVFKSGILSKMEERLAEWSFESYLGMIAELRGVDLSALEAAAKGFLESTDEIYTAEVERLLEEQLGMSLRRARGYDIPFVLKGTWLDGGLSSDGALAAAEETLRGMGLKADKSNLDLKPMAFCGQRGRPGVFPLRVPEEIKMCYSDVGGVGDYAAHLYLRGKAEYFASIRQPKWFELRVLGDGSLCEASGLLFQSLVSNEKWLTEKAGLNPESARAIARHQAFVSLFEGRNACMATLYQIEVYSGGTNPEQAYSKLLGTHMKWDTVLDRNRSALALDDLASADLVHGYFLASQLRSTLEEKFGERWFTSAEAGVFLKELWKPGQASDAGSMAKTLGHNSLDSSYMIADLSKAIPSEE